MGLGQTIRVMQESMAEKKDQKGKGTTEGFVATNTDRVDRLVSRLAPNETQLKTYIKELNLFKPRAQELFNSVQSVLAANSPLPTDTTRGDSPGAPASLGNVVGQNPISRLDTTVILPIERWLAEYHAVKTDRHPVMEKTRLELDSRRRQEIELQQELAELRGMELPTDASKLDKHNRKFEEKAHLLAHKQTKMHAVNKTFIDQEAAVHQHLLALAEDAELIPEYMAETLVYFKDMFGRALDSFPHGMRPIPPTTALERSNHNELWKEANTPNVPIPVLPEPVPATTYTSSPATTPMTQSAMPAAADLASPNHGALRDVTQDRAYRETHVPPAQQYNNVATVPPQAQQYGGAAQQYGGAAQQYGGGPEAVCYENASVLPFRDQPTFVKQAPAHHEAAPFVNEAAPFAGQNSTSAAAYPAHTNTIPQYGIDQQGGQYGAASSYDGLPRTGQLEGQHGVTSPGVGGQTLDGQQAIHHPVMIVPASVTGSVPVVMPLQR